MAILTSSGRAAIAASIKEQAIHLAWGTGDPAWGSAHNIQTSFTDDVITLSQNPIKDVIVKEGETTFTPGADYSVDSVAGTITRLPLGIIAEDAVLDISYTQDTPREEITSTALLNPVGLRTVDEVLFCSGDENGELITPSGRFTASQSPTNNLFLKFTFDFEDAANQVIQELGVMVGSEFLAELPEGQRYFTPDQITTEGILLVLEHTVPLVRTAATRETFTFVVTF